MVTRIGHIALHVKDLDAAVEFQQQVIGMVETERLAGASYMTWNERHHELILIEDPIHRGYEHLALEVADAGVLEGAAKRLTAAGGTTLGGIYDGEPGIDRALKVKSPTGHVYKLFCGMENLDPPPRGDRPVKFEHISCKVANHRAEEHFLTEGLGFRLSDRMGFLASWWHCDEDHHGIALTLAPRSELSHYQWSDFAALGRVADRLKAHRGRKCIWGPSRHGPGNNQFLYLHDEDGAMIERCSEIAQMTVDHYQPKNWSVLLVAKCGVRGGGQRGCAFHRPARLRRRPNRVPSGVPSSADLTPDNVRRPDEPLHQPGIRAPELELRNQRSGV